MKKKSIVVLIAVVLCLLAAQSAFAIDYDSNEYRMFDYTKEEYTLDEAFWFNPTIYCIDVAQFIQAYIMPEDPVSFYLSACKFTDEEIDNYFVIFQSFIEPEYVGYVGFADSCDVEAFAESLGYVFDADSTYSFSILFEYPEDIARIFPRGIGRSNAYDTFRRAALQLAIYATEHGTTPGFEACYEYIQYVFAYYEQQYEAAMAAEAAASAPAEEAVVTE